jgi:hypothetical protein
MDRSVSFFTQREYAEVKSLDLANPDPMEGQVELIELPICR